MKSIVIILSINALIMICGDKLQSTKMVSEVQAISCPEKNDKSIFLINAIFTNSELQDEMKQLGLDTYIIDMDRTKLLEKPDLPEFLRSYWRERGIEQVSDPEVCKKISETLDNDERNKQYLEEYDRVYYKADNKYVILYHFKQAGLSERTTPHPQILNNQFNIIGKLDLKK